MAMSLLLSSLEKISTANCSYTAFDWQKDGVLCRIYFETHLLADF